MIARFRSWLAFRRFQSRVAKARQTAPDDQRRPRRGCAMSRQTYTVQLCWTTAAGDVWVTVNGHPGPLRIDARVDAGASVRVVDGKAVRA